MKERVVEFMFGERERRGKKTNMNIQFLFLFLVGTLLEYFALDM